MLSRFSGNSIYYPIPPGGDGILKLCAFVFRIRFGLLGVNASATARVISRRRNDDEISFLVEETGVPGGNHRPTASNFYQSRLALTW